MILIWDNFHRYQKKVEKLMKDCFGSAHNTKFLQEYMSEVYKLDYTETPDYIKLKWIFTKQLHGRDPTKTLEWLAPAKSRKVSMIICYRFDIILSCSECQMKSCRHQFPKGLVKIYHTRYEGVSWDCIHLGIIILLICSFLPALLTETINWWIPTDQTKEKATTF